MAPSDAEMAVLVYRSYVDDYSVVACAALLLYDFSLTLSQEIEHIWRRKLTGPSLLFIVNRASTFLFFLAEVWYAPSWNTLGLCRFMFLWSYAPQLLLQFCWASFSALRVFVIAGRAWFLACIVFVISITPFALQLFDDVAPDSFKIYYVTPSLTLCLASDASSPALRTPIELSMRIASIASDLMVLMITWWKTFHLRREALELNIKMPLVTILLRDGTSFFLIMLVLNVLQMLNFYVSLTSLDITYMVTTFTSILMSRFILNLRDVSAHPEGLGGISVGSLYQSGINFPSRVVGNMGAEVDGTFGLGDVGAVWEGDASGWDEDNEKVFEVDDVESGERGETERESDTVREDLRTQDTREIIEVSAAGSPVNSTVTVVGDH